MRDDRGTIATEYAILAMLIAVVIVGSVWAIGVQTDANIAGAMRIFAR